MGQNVLGVAVCEINGLLQLYLAFPELTWVTTTSLHLVDLRHVAFGLSVSAVIDRWEQAARLDLMRSCCPPSARPAPGTRFWRLQRRGGAPRASARPPFATARGRPPRAAPRGAPRGGRYPDFNTSGRGPRRMHTWPRAGRSVKHLARQGVPGLLGGCWGRTRDAGGPTGSELHACVGFMR